MNRNRFRIAVALLLCGVLALTLADPASAFIRIGRQASPTDPVVQAHWFPSELPLNSVVNPTNNDKSDAVALGEIVTSAETWENITTSFFTVNAHQFAGPPELPPALEFDGQNSVLFDLTGANFSPGVIAFVRSIIDGTDGHTLDADMVFNDRDFFWSVTSPGLEPAPVGQSSVDLQSVACHEWGHYFSLDHTSVLGATMIPFIQNNTSQRTLELDDRAGNSTVYPEANFATDFGTVSGTVVSGFNGSATFGAHVEAILLSAPTPANSISAISGELTLRNGLGEYTIYGLPPGDYAIRIVPLDGIHTTAADANVGGPYNNLDVNFEVEFWNGANEGADGFTDLAADFTPVTVGAGSSTSGIDFITNTFAGRVIIAQHGQFENFVTFRNTGFLAVRFDPPFATPFTISNVEFPSFTFNGVPATFLSARLCPLNTATGLPNLAAPIFSQTPFVGSPNGVNTVPLNLSVTSPDQTLFWLLEFPSAAIPGFPNNFPFLRMDFTLHERGLFANTYSISTAGAGGILIDRNVVVSMTCQMGNVADGPIAATSNLGGNRTDTNMEFTYAKPGDVRADGFPMPGNSLEEVALIARPAGPPGTYTTIATAGAGAANIKLDPQPSNTSPLIFSSQAVDKNGHRSLQSNVSITAISEDADEPNGRRNQATPLTAPVVNRPSTYSPAGDQDFFEVMAKPGDVLDARATAAVVAGDNANNLDLVMLVLDNSGDLLAFNDDFTGLNPRVVVTIPPPGGNSHSQQPRKITIWLTDFFGSLFAPTGAPRLVTPQGYTLNATVTTPASAAASFARGLNPDAYHFVNSGPNPANPTVKLFYAIPRNAGSQEVRLKIYDVNGRLVRSLVNGSQDAGPHTAVWDGRDDHGRSVASGNYFARIDVGKAFTHDARITLLK